MLQWSRAELRKRSQFKEVDRPERSALFYVDETEPSTLWMTTRSRNDQLPQEGDTLRLKLRARKSGKNILSATVVQATPGDAGLGAAYGERYGFRRACFGFLEVDWNDENPLAYM